MRTQIQAAKRIVIKIGTSSLTHENGKIDLEKMDKLARVLTDLNNSGREIMLVSSGAVNAGMQRIGRSKRPEDLSLKQATAAIGQGILMKSFLRNIIRLLPKYYLQKTLFKMKSKVQMPKIHLKHS